MIICYGRYPVLDRSVMDDWAESSARFKATGLATPGNLGFYFADDLFEPDLVHMIHRWEDEESFGLFRTSEGHDRRIAETDAWGEAEQVIRADLVFFRGAEDQSVGGDEVCVHLVYDSDPDDDEFFESSRRFQEVGLSSPGNSGFSMGRDRDNRRLVHLWHLWESTAAFDAFMVSPGHLARRDEMDAMDAKGRSTRTPERRILHGQVTRRIRR
jgi:quinol monooxygenase YgiN